MKKNNNSSYNNIIKYIKSNPSLNEQKKRFLISYATNLYMNNIENKEKEDVYTILNDLRILNENLSNSSNTSFVAKRLEKEIEIFQLLNRYYRGENVDISEISYELDKLYLLTDLGIRENSSLAYNLTKEEKEKMIL